MLEWGDSPKTSQSSRAFSGVARKYLTPCSNRSSNSPTTSIFGDMCRKKKLDPCIDLTVPPEVLGAVVANTHVTSNVGLFSTPASPKTLCRLTMAPDLIMDDASANFTSGNAIALRYTPSRTGFKTLPSTSQLITREAVAGGESNKRANMRVVHTLGWCGWRKMFIRSRRVVIPFPTSSRQWFQLVLSFRRTPRHPYVVTRFPLVQNFPTLRPTGSLSSPHVHHLILLLPSRAAIARMNP